MIKLLLFSGPCSFASFLAVAGDGALQAIRLVRTLQNGGVVCFVCLDAVDTAAKSRVLEAIQTAHALEPVQVHHDVVMSESVLDKACEWLSRGL
jgi:hypothetical protein